MVEQHPTRSRVLRQHLVDRPKDGAGPHRDVAQIADGRADDVQRPRRDDGVRYWTFHGSASKKPADWSAWRRARNPLRNVA
jgi:hypothetical protein